MRSEKDKEKNSAIGVQTKKNYNIQFNILHHGGH